LLYHLIGDSTSRCAHSKPKDQTVVGEDLVAEGLNWRPCETSSVVEYSTVFGLMENETNHLIAEETEETEQIKY
jgi:hypothetical protein